MQEILNSIESLLDSCTSFKDKITALAKDAGIDTRSKAGIPHDLVTIMTKPGKDITHVVYIEFVVIMLTLMVRSYMGKNDSGLVTDLDKCFDKYFEQMTTAERLFYLLLKVRLGDVMFNHKPVSIALMGYEDEDLIKANSRPS